MVSVLLYLPWHTAVFVISKRDSKLIYKTPELTSSFRKLTAGLELLILENGNGVKSVKWACPGRPKNQRAGQGMKFSLLKRAIPGRAGLSNSSRCTGLVSYRVVDAFASSNC